MDLLLCNSQRKEANCASSLIRSVLGWIRSEAKQLAASGNYSPQEPAEMLLFQLKRYTRKKKEEQKGQCWSPCPLAHHTELLTLVCIASSSSGQIYPFYDQLAFRSHAFLKIQMERLGTTVLVHGNIPMDIKERSFQNIHCVSDSTLKYPQVLFPPGHQKELERDLVILM